MLSLLLPGIDKILVDRTMPISHYDAMRLEKELLSIYEARMLLENKRM